MKAAKSYTEGTSESTAKPRKLNLVSHIAVFITRSSFFPKAILKPEEW